MTQPITSNNSLPRIQETPATDYYSFTQFATDTIKALGVMLMAVGFGCIMAGVQLPPIALLVLGAAALVFGFLVPRKEPLPPLEEVSVPSSLVSEISFGREEWLNYIGDPGVVPPLPTDIEAILAAPCPFWAAKRVVDTHALVLVPEQVTRVVERSVTEPFTLRSLNRIMRTANNGQGPGCGEIAREINMAANADASSESHWVLMTTESVPGTGQRETIQADIEFIENKGYKIPKCLDAATTILLQNLNFIPPIFGFTGANPLYTGFQEYTTWYDERRGGVTYGYIGEFIRNELSIEIRGDRFGNQRPGFAAVRTFS